MLDADPQSGDHTDCCHVEHGLLFVCLGQGGEGWGPEAAQSSLGDGGQQSSDHTITAESGNNGSTISQEVQGASHRNMVDAWGRGEEKEQEERYDVVMVSFPL